MNSCVLRTLSHSLVFVLMAAVAQAQSTKPVNKSAGAATSANPTPPPKAKSPCPDTAYQKACDSYAELLKAKDDDVKTDVGQGGVAFVCFRSEADSFFVFTLNGPFWSKRHFDAEKKASVPDRDATSKRVGFANEFVDGIGQNRTMPVRSFSGSWEFPEDPMFTADTVNRKAADDYSSLIVDRSQGSALVCYKNQTDKNVDYVLVIQRSTGRFTEHYTQESQQTPFLEQQGRCVVPQK